MLDSQLTFGGRGARPRRQALLGWEQNVQLEKIAKDLKQLPCQRPRRPVNVEVGVGR